MWEVKVALVAVYSHNCSSFSHHTVTQTKPALNACLPKCLAWLASTEQVCHTLRAEQLLEAAWWWWPWARPHCFCSKGSSWCLVGAAASGSLWPQQVWTVGEDRCLSRNQRARTIRVPLSTTKTHIAQRNPILDINIILFLSSNEVGVFNVYVAAHWMNSFEWWKVVIKVNLVFQACKIDRLTMSEWKSSREANTTIKK